MAGAAERGLVSDEATSVELVETVVHEHHAVFVAHLEPIFELVDVVFADQVAAVVDGNAVKPRTKAGLATKLIKLAEGFQEYVMALRPSPSGSHLASAARDSGSEGYVPRK